MIAPVLRDYQRACIDAVFDFVSTREGNALAVLPTGSGKSLVMGSLIAEARANAPTMRALVLAHRKELIQQNVRAVASVLPLAQIGVYSAGLNQKDTESPIIVAGIQSAARKPYAFGAFDVILVDECQLIPTDDDTLYRSFLKAARVQNPYVRLIGLTATPYRLTSGLLHRGPKALFADIAYSASIPELIAGGYLCPLISKATLVQLDTTNVAMRGGEFVASALERAVDVDDTNVSAIDEMMQLFADRKKWLVFAAGVSHATHLADLLNQRGIATVAVHGDMPADERAYALNAFKDGKLRALTSVDVLSVGFDEPSIDAIAMLRPTKSTGLFVQQAGRGFRIHPGKTNCLILDFAGNVARHGPVDAIEVRDKGSAGGEGATPTKTCPVCRSIEHAGVHACTVCGYEFPKPEPPAIDPTASTLAILSTEPKPVTWHEVTSVEYHYHQRDEKTPSLRVEYYHVYRRVAAEWICLEHEGFARKKAESWWKRRSTEPVPATIDEALQLTDDLLTPKQIATQPDGRWTRVVDYELPEITPLPGLPRACWTCRFWSETKKCCRKWEATPPADVQSSGCDSWIEAEAPF